MAETAPDTETISGTALKRAGGAVLVLTVLVFLWAVGTGDVMTAGASLLYVPVGALLLAIGRKAELV